MLRLRIFYVAVFFACIAFFLLIEWIATPRPSTRKIHVEAFRYGTSPSIIRANRGDRIILSFSTRDTAHSFFLQDYRIDAKIAPASEMVEVRDPLRSGDPPAYVREIELTAGLPGLWGRLVSVSRFRCHVYCGPMHGFEQGDLVVRPNWLMAGSMGLLLAMVITGWQKIKSGNAGWETRPQRPIDLNRRVGLLDMALKWRPLQFTCTLPLLAGLMLILLAGLLGTKVGGRNVAVMLTWIVWISLLALFLVPLGGRIWCLICPLPVVGEYLQRGATTEVREGKGTRFGNRFFGLAKGWPGALKGPWLRLCLFIVLGTLSASLAGQPKWTAILLITMVAAGIVISLVWELRSFCRYVCPVAAFISAYSAMGRLMVRNRDPVVCKKCVEKPCLRGNARGWACPYGLLLAQVDRNTDCGMCFECFKSCPNDNVSLAWRRGPWRERFRSYGEAWQAIVLLVLALVYSLTIHSPWPVMRDMVNLVDRASPDEFVLFLVVLGVVALGLVPLIFWVVCGLGLRLVEGTPGKGKTYDPDGSGSWNRFFSPSVGEVFKKTMPALLPIGLALWAVFFVETIMANMTFILLSLSDPFGWGWDLFGTAGMPWVQVWPSGIPWIQAALILTGLHLSLKKGCELWDYGVDVERNVLIGFAPTGAVMIAIAGGMLLYITHY